MNILARSLLLAMVAFAASSLAPVTVRAQTYGEALVRANCSACHAISLDDASSHPEAPAFRDLHKRYPLDALEEAFVEGIAVGHPDMPEFIATPEQIDAIIDYLDTLDR